MRLSIPKLGTSKPQSRRTKRDQAGASLPFPSLHFILILIEALARGLHDQDHSGPDHGDVAVVALEGGDGRSVSVGNRVEGLTALHFVVNHSNLRGFRFE